MTTARHFKAIAAVEPSDHEIEAFAKGRGVPVIRAVEQPPVQPQATSSTEPAVPSTRVGLDIPLYLADELKIRAVKERCSTRFLILKAIQAAGYRVDDNDLIADGRRTR